MMVRQSTVPLISNKLGTMVHTLYRRRLYSSRRKMWRLCHTVDTGTVQYSTVQYSAVQYSTVQYSTVLYSKVSYGKVLYRTVKYILLFYCLNIFFLTFQEDGEMRTQKSRFREHGSVSTRYFQILMQIFQMLIQIILDLVSDTFRS